MPHSHTAINNLVYVSCALQHALPSHALRLIPEYDRAVQEIASPCMNSFTLSIHFLKINQTDRNSLGLLFLILKCWMYQIPTCIHSKRLQRCEIQTIALTGKLYRLSLWSSLALKFIGKNPRTHLRSSLKTLCMRSKESCVPLIPSQRVKWQN